MLKDGDHKLPIFIDRNFIDYIPPEILDIARQVRNSVGDLPEHVVRRKVRDHLDVEKRRVGLLTQGGAELMQAKIEAALEDTPLEG
jgi:rRNA-processing protein FCF1